MKLAAHYIDPSEFASKSWWKPLRPGVQWFYHAPRSNTNIQNHSIVDIATVDQPLIPIVNLCNTLGIKTMPSCAGHDVSEDYSKRLFAQLKDDASVIPQKGLIFENVEDRQRLLYRDPHYTIPWTHFFDLHAHLELYERMGVIGFKLGDTAHDREFLRKLLVIKTNCKTIQNNPNCVEIVHKGNTIIELWVSCESIAKQNKVWSEIYDVLAR